MEASENSIAGKRPLEQTAVNPLKRDLKKLRIGNEFYDYDWNCYNCDAAWSGLDSK